MGTITIEGLGEVQISGDTPNAKELQAIVAALKEKQATPSKAAEQPDLGNAIAGSASANLPRENAPSAAAINLGAAHGMKQDPNQTPLQAGADLIKGIYDPKRGWFKGSDATRDIAKMPSIVGGSVIAPLSTSDPHKRQRIYVKEIPGAKAVFDKWGNPMIEIDGKRYYTDGTDMDIARGGLAVAGGMAGSLLLPTSGVGMVLGSGALAGTQSVAEDVIAGATAGDKPETWVDPEKAGMSTALGALIPLGIIKAPAIAGRFNELLKRGTPLTDDALIKAGLTPEQIESLTPELRAQITSVARRTFGNPTAVGSTYREGLADEFGITGPAGLTRGDVSGDAVQIAREQKLQGGGNADAAKIINDRRAAQDAALNQAQVALRAQAGGRPGQQAMTPEEASALLQGKRDAAEATQQAATDQAYKLARDPAAIEAAGGRATAPAPHSSQIGRSTREMLAADEKVGQIVLGDSAADVTPYAKKALEATEKWSKSRVGPRADLAKLQGAKGDTVYDPEGLLAGPPGSTTRRVAIDEPGTATTFPEVTWQEAERLRQQLVGLRNKAAEAAAQPGASGQDLAAMEKILANFDNHFGALNPLYAPARKAHETLKSVFTSGGSIDHDAATKAVLKVMEGPEGGAAITNTIFGPGFSKNQAGQMLEHLNTRVFKDHPEARDAIKEMAVRRLLVDKNGDALSPLKMRDAIGAAFGEREGSLYRQLFLGDELAKLRRLHELQDVIAKGRIPINPPRSGLLVNTLVKEVLGATSGAGVGFTVGGGMGAMAGAAAGGVAAKYLPIRQAAQAVNVAPGAFAQGAPSRVPGLLGQTAAPTAGAAVAAQPGQPGPMDRLWQGILGGP